MRPLALLPAALLVLAGCSSPEPEPLSADTYQMTLSGVPAQAVAPGAAFNVSVQSAMGMGMRMHRMESDHIGAHFWNRSAADPTADLGNATACAHTGGQMPGAHTATCTAPMQPGTYRIRAHARMSEGGAMHHWWSDEQTFTVA